MSRRLLDNQKEPGPYGPPEKRIGHLAQMRHLKSALCAVVHCDLPMFAFALSAEQLSPEFYRSGRAGGLLRWRAGSRMIRMRSLTTCFLIAACSLILFAGMPGRDPDWLLLDGIWRHEAGVTKPLGRTLYIEGVIVK
jgi:hypothetical protein